MEDKKKIAMCYKPLIDHMHEKHGIILSVFEMEQIKRVCSIVSAKLKESQFESLQHYFKADSQGSRFCECGQYITDKSHFRG